MMTYPAQASRSISGANHRLGQFLKHFLHFHRDNGDAKRTV